MTDRREGYIDDDHDIGPRVGAAEPQAAYPHVEERRRQGRTAAPALCDRGLILTLGCRLPTILTESG